MTVPEKTRVIALAAGTLVILLATASTAAAERTLNVTAMDDGALDTWFEIEGLDGRNPTITLTPGEEVTVNLQNEGQLVHNIRFGGGIDEGMDLVQPGQNDTMTFMVPPDASGDAEYWCVPHQSAPYNMRGEIRFEAAGGNQTDDGNQTGNGNDTGNGDEATEDTPGFTAAFALAAAFGVALALSKRRRA